jgi:Sec-independent protein translocase protein TatA
MFDISFSQLLVCSVVTLTVIGRKDMPKAARMLGSGVGNSVSFLRYVRQSADKFTASIEASEGSAAMDIKSLRDEVSLGLREIEDVRRDLVQGVDDARVGAIMNNRGLAQASRRVTSVPGTSVPGTSVPGTSVLSTSMPGTSMPGISAPTSGQTTAAVSTADFSHAPPAQPSSHARAPLPSRPPTLASSTLTSAAVAESTWSGEISQIPASAFQSAVGERGSGTGDDGASALADLYKETLIMDHYERVKDK